MISNTPDPLSTNTPLQVEAVHKTNENPTRVRYGVLAFLAAMTFILYIDRSCINQAAPIIRRELAISQTHIGYVFNAFAIAYAIFEVPAGHWGDRFGSRRILTRIVLWWSLFTALTGAASSFASLVVIRFLFGAGEAGALPNSARVLHTWFPDSARGKAQGFVTTAMMIGGACAPRIAMANRLNRLAVHIRGFRVCRRDLGSCVFYLVPRRSCAAPPYESSRAAIDRRGTRFTYRPIHH